MVISPFERSRPEFAIAAPHEAVPEGAEDRDAIGLHHLLRPSYAVVAFDRLPIRIRARAGARDSALLFALGIGAFGNKDILGLWLARGPQPWGEPLSDLRRRGLRRWQIAIADLAQDDAFAHHFAEGSIQQSVPRLLRRSLMAVPPNRCKAVTAGLLDILHAESEALAQEELQRFARGRAGAEHPEITRMLRQLWPLLALHVALPIGVRRFLEGFDAFDSLKAKLARRGTRLTPCFAGEDEALTETAAALAHVATDWKVAPRLWSAANRHFATLEQLPRSNRAGATAWRARFA